MRKLSFLYKKLSFFNISNQTHLSNLIFLCLLSCNQILPKGTDTFKLSVFKNPDGFILEDKLNCNNFSLGFVSPLGEHSLDIKRLKDLSSLSWGSRATYSLDHQSLKDVCDFSNMNLSKLAEAIKPYMTYCQTLEEKAGKLYCDWPEQKEFLNDRYLIRSIKRKLLFSNKRIPYVISRRVAVIEMMIAAVKETKEEKNKLETICAVIKSSSSEELPLILQSKVWQAAICGDSTEANKEKIAKFVLSISAQEISRYLQLMKNSNKTGYLNYKYAAKKEYRNSRFFIKLRPTDLARSHFINQISLIDKKETVFGSSCIVPGFGEQEFAYKAGILLGLWHSCRIEVERSDILIDKMILVISAETEFVISNRHSKVLSLPVGSYDYFVSDIPYRLDEANYEKIIDSGRINWKSNQRYIKVVKRHFQ